MIVRCQCDAQRVDAHQKLSAAAAPQALPTLRRLGVTCADAERFGDGSRAAASGFLPGVPLGCLGMGD
jgi:hypothetical protein